VEAILSNYGKTTSLLVFVTSLFWLKCWIQVVIFGQV